MGDVQAVYSGKMCRTGTRNEKRLEIVGLRCFSISEETIQIVKYASLFMLSAWQYKWPSGPSVVDFK